MVFIRCFSPSPRKCGYKYNSEDMNISDTLKEGGKIRYSQGYKWFYAHVAIEIYGEPTQYVAWLPICYQWLPLIIDLLHSNGMIAYTVRCSQTFMGTSSMRMKDFPEKHVWLQRQSRWFAQHWTTSIHVSFNTLNILQDIQQIKHIARYSTD